MAKRKILHIALFLAAGIRAFAGTQADTVSPPVLGKLVDVAGVRVHIYCIGQGSPTVVVASGGFSYDWGLVQPQIAKTTRICTYDPSGTAWSDPMPVQTTPTCGERVDELHSLLGKAGVEGPYIVVGYSIGGLIARLYAARYPNEIGGLVLVDHAFLDAGGDAEPKPAPSSFKDLDSPPVLLSESAIALDLEDDQNFSKLPARDQELHKWALSRSLRPTAEMAAGCFAEVEKAEKRVPFPLAAKPVAVVSTSNDSPRYAELQRKLMALSENSKHFIAENSSHMVIIDQPGTVIQAIRQIVAWGKEAVSKSK